MAIELINDTILKASPSSEHPTSNALVPLSIFDKAAFDLHVPILYAFRAPVPSNEAMREGLSKALAHYPHLAGRFTTDDQGRTCIILNNAGVRIIETYVPITLAEQLPFTPDSEVGNLLPPLEGVEELLQVQLNRYACGGLVLGLSSHHRVADGQSMSYFTISWSSLVRGLDIEAFPYHDRDSVSVPRNPPRVEFDHPNIEFRKNTSSNTNELSSSITNLIVHLSADFVTKLKAKVCQGNKRYSTFECLLSHLWKKMTQARGLERDEFTQVRVAVNGRARMKPPVPMEYFGNLVLWAYPRLRVKELLNESCAYVAKAIHEAVAKIDHEYFQSFIDFGELSKGKEDELVATAPEAGNALCPNLEVDSWLRFHFHDLDFGGGAPCAFMPPDLPVEGLLVFVPSCKEIGGVDVFLALLDEHVEHFKQICYALD
ncbi:PREDICTED: agmatine coumaroyltransferase-2-like [Nelumbo nucifera]|uniref:Agmatine coumaroyltransferase-2-like n=1 Tax=Nelumbo nucifera TaxID=4432 RepID=A0A1U7ZDV8_NELNU|nr:PREDICTED: agmatine coumaroyltransferase-2-like [Nelumbo nucifera]